MRNIKNETGVDTEELDFGGGFGIHYVSEDKPLEPDEYIKFMTDALKARV